MSRRIGPSSAAALVVANMIGAGVFTTSGYAVADLGRPEPVLAAWAVGGAIALCGALAYGALGRRFPESGGEFLFLSRTVHPLAGFTAGWVSLLAGFTAPIAVAAHGFEAYAERGLGLALPPGLPGSAAILAAGLLHGVRLRGGLRAQDLAVALKLAALLGFVAWGGALLAARPGSPSAGASPTAAAALDPGAFAVALVWISFAYSGWNAAVYVAGEVRRPERNLPRALVGATVLVTLLYLALNAVFLYAAPVSALAGRAEVGAVAAEALGGAPMRRALSGLVALGLLTSISSMVMAGPRVYQRMAEDGLLPSVFGGTGDVPRAAVALQTGLALAVLHASTLAELLSYAGFTLGLSAAATVLGLFRVRAREGAARVPIPGHPWVPGVFVVATLGSSAFLVVRQPAEAAAGLATVLAGLPLYAWAERRRRASGRPGTGTGRAEP